MGALQAVSYELRQKFPDSRRNVLFDDETKDLVLDFTTDDKTWRRMTSQQARDRKKKQKTGGGNFTLEADEIDAILDGDPATSP